MKTITLPVSWEVSGFVKVQAESIEAAVEYFNSNIDHIPLPKEHEYVDASFQLTDSDPDYIKLYNKDEMSVLDVFIEMDKIQSFMDTGLCEVYTEEAADRISSHLTAHGYECVVTYNSTPICELWLIKKPDGILPIRESEGE